MFEELLPTGLTSAARRLGVEPLEVVRLMVVSDTVTPGFIVTPEHLHKLQRLGGIEGGWWQGIELPEDASPARARVRAALGLLLKQGADGPIRMDNLWRGLSLDDQGLIEEALNLLADEEIVLVENAEMGVVVSVPPASRDRVQRISDGAEQVESLEPLFAG